MFSTPIIILYGISSYDTDWNRPQTDLHLHTGTDLKQTYQHRPLYLLFSLSFSSLCVRGCIDWEKNDECLESAVEQVSDLREKHKAITPTTNASKSRLQLTQREISPTHHTLILNGFSNSQKASITQHGPRTACAGCIESQNGGIFFAALQAKSAYKTGY